MESAHESTRHFLLKFYFPFLKSFFLVNQFAFLVKMKILAESVTP